MNDAASPTTIGTASGVGHLSFGAVDGVHDMGGMHGFGPVIERPDDRRLDEPVFHEPWEGRTLALMVGTAATGVRPGSLRPRIEELDPATYLASSYYERWARAIEADLVANGSLTADEIDERSHSIDAGAVRSDGTIQPDPHPPPRSGVGRLRRPTNPDLVAALPRFLNAPGPTSGEPVPGAAYAVGDRVTVRRMAPAGHHRCPRYVRGVSGTVERVAGGWAPPGADEPEALYTVRFDMADLWGDDAESGALYIDLWERYLA